MSFFPNKSKLNVKNVKLFRTNSKVHWLISGISLFMYQTSADFGQLYAGAINDRGIYGAWYIWVSLFTAGFIPFLFAPLWAKMNFITDNQFILYRFSGIGAKILHLFRALYVGGIVVSFLIAYQLISFSRIIAIIFDFNEGTAKVLCVIILFLYTVANTFNLQLKTDFINAVIFVLTLCGVWYFLSLESGGLSYSISQIAKTMPEKLQLIPKNDFEFNKTLLIYFGIQWWSINLADGGGPEMARFTSTKSLKGAMLAGLTPAVLRIVLIAFFVSIILMSISISGISENGEVNYLTTLFNVLPEYWKIIVGLGLFSLFITSSTSLLRWGGSFVSIDFYKGYANRKSDKYDLLVSILAFLLIVILAYFIAINLSSLEQIIKIVFSISAGVAPVFILRWFWLRINAWSQLAAMISSGVYTIALYALESSYPFLQIYEVKLILITLLVSITWLAVTFLTPKDDKKTLNHFRSILPSRKEIFRRTLIALAFGTALLILLFLTLKLIIR